MKAIVFYPKYNSPNKRDADEFRVEAHRFAAAHPFTTKLCEFDNRAPAALRRNEVIAAASVEGPVDVVAFFCHGWPTGIQAGFTNVQAAAFVQLFADYEDKECALKVLLYCCSTAADGDKSALDEKEPGPGGDGGFADAVRDAANSSGVKAAVFAHTVKGHTSANPWLRVFAPAESKGGAWLVDPEGPLWARWAKALQFVSKDKSGHAKVDEANTFRFRFPFMPASDLRSELQKKR